MEQQATFGMGIPGTEGAVAGAGHQRAACQGDIVDPVAVALVPSLCRFWMLLLLVAASQAVLHIPPAAMRALCVVAKRKPPQQRPWRSSTGSTHTGAGYDVGPTCTYIEMDRHVILQMRPCRPSS